MNKILITGGAGFIGHSLAVRLSDDKENDITITDNLLRGRKDSDLERLLECENVRFIEGDLTNPDFVKHLGGHHDYIYHLAAVIGVDNVLKNPDRVLYVNAVSTLNLFECLKNIEGVKRVFFSSSSEVYVGTLKHFGIEVPTGEKVHLTIEDISADRTTYALSKIYGEAIALVYGRKYGIPVIIGRFHNIYGPRMGYSHVIPETFVKIEKNSVVDVPSPTHTRAFCFINDAVNFIIKASLNAECEKEILHIGNPKEEIKISDLVGKIADIMGRDISINELADTPGSPARRCPDTAKIEKLTGYKPVVRLDEGIRRTYQWYKDNL